MFHKNTQLTYTLLAVGLSSAASVAFANPGVVISQVYGGGGNGGSLYTNDFIELFNAGSTAASLAGWSLQYASATGTGNFGASASQITELPALTLQPGQYLLVQQEQGAGGSMALPTPDVIDPSPINISASGGKVALVNTSTSLGCNGSSTPCSSTTLTQIVDLVGYGSANFFEGADPTLASNNTTAALRANSGCTDTNNSADFTIDAPNPRNTTSPLNLCTVSNAPVSNMRIHDIQGAAHRSPLTDQTVINVPGVVTAVRHNGFYMEDSQPDSNLATSEGIFVFTGSAPTVIVDQAVQVSGAVSEFRPGGSGGIDNLTLTQISNPILTFGNSAGLPPPVIIGNGGRIPPQQVIEDDANGDVETSGEFDPANDGLDFYESLEGMRVVINNAVVVGPTSNFGEIPVIGDNGANAAVRSVRGGLVIATNDFNPERVIIDDALLSAPQVNVNVGDTFATIAGVMDYSFGNYKLLVTAPLTATANGLAPETTALSGDAERLTVASFNVENLDALDGPAKFAALAGQIVNNLRAPDLLGLMEVQDSDGRTNNGVVAADVTLNPLIAAIQTAGGPTYAYRQIDPVNNQDGGEPGGNIRVAFLFNPARVSFVDRPGGDATTAVTVITRPGGPQLSVSPGRLEPTNPAFANSRKPIAGEFLFNDRRLFVVANHWNSKGGDQPLFGRFQPPQRSSEVQRNQQAAVVRDFTTSLLTADPNAHLIVLGELNDFEFSDAITLLKNAGLHDLVETLPANERYTYVFDGNSQVLDHILVSDALLNSAAEYDVVHVNAEFAEQVSDHDPEVARFTLPPAVTDITNQFAVTISGLTFNRRTQQF